MSIPIWLLILHLTEVHSGSHYLRYYYAGITDPRSGFFEFSAFGLVDDKIIMSYHSDIREVRPGADWMKKNLNHDYWESETRIDRGHEDLYRRLHVYQSMYGCELYDDGSTRGYTQHAYDGKDFLSLDKDRMVYVPSMDEAQTTTQRWNLDRSFAERRKIYLDKECIEWLQKYVSYGKEVLERKVKPKVKVWSQMSGPVIRLYCMAYGFYPQDLDMKWTLNEQEIPLEEVKQILPNPDGTYQTRVTVEVVLLENQVYACHVDHSSLLETIKVPWKPQNEELGSTLIICVTTGLVLLAIFLLGYISFRKSSACPEIKAANYGPTPAADVDVGQSSASSSSSV